MLRGGKERDWTESLRLLELHVDDRMRIAEDAERAAADEQRALIDWMRSGRTGVQSREQLQRAADLFGSRKEIILPSFDSELVRASLRTLTNMKHRNEGEVRVLVNLLDSDCKRALLGCSTQWLSLLFLSTI
jgi:hypothetical protein